MKRQNILLTVLVVLMLTASTASASNLYHQHGKHHLDSHQSKHHNHCVCDSKLEENPDCNDLDCSDDTSCSSCNSEENIESEKPADSANGPINNDKSCSSCNAKENLESEDIVHSEEVASQDASTDETETTTVKLCSDNVCTVGGDGQVLELINYNNAINPTYDQLLSFLKEDKTDEKPYTSTYVCSDFAKDLHDNAEKAGIKAGWVGSDSADHAFNVFKTTDSGTVYIDCTGVPGGDTLQDKKLNVEKGQPLTGEYLFRSGSLEDMGTIEDLKIYW
jgi:hypothetical protein